MTFFNSFVNGHLTLLAKSGLTIRVRHSEACIRRKYQHSDGQPVFTGRLALATTDPSLEYWRGLLVFPGAGAVSCLRDSLQRGAATFASVVPAVCIFGAVLLREGQAYGRAQKPEICSAFYNI